MSYRPTIKNNDSGSVTDLALDAETVQGYKPCINVVTLEDNGSTTAGEWLAKSSKISSLVDGQLYLYKITVAGASTTTLNITGSGGTALGAKTVYRTGTTKLTTQYGVGHYILLVYNDLNTSFRVINDYDANSYAYVRQYQHGDNAEGTTNLYPILTRYNLTNKNGTYDTAYSRFHTGTYINITNGYLYAPKVYSGGSEVALKTDIPAAVTESTVSGWGFTKNAGTVTSVSAGTGLSISGTATTTPTVNVASGYKLPTTTEWNNKLTVNLIEYENNSVAVIRITNMSEGRYLLRGAEIYQIYYNGATSTDVCQVCIINYAAGLMLEVRTPETDTWTWTLVTPQPIDGGVMIYSGAMSRSSGTYSLFNSISVINHSAYDASGSSATKPIYISDTTVNGYRHISTKLCNEYAGGTAVTLNGTSKSANTASFYAPTASGTSGQFLKSAGANKSPTWVNLATVATSGSYNDLTNKPTIPTAVTESTVSGWGFTKNAGTVTSVRVQAGTGLSSSTSTAQSSTLNTTISIASGYKLPTTTEWGNKADSSALGDQVTYSFSGGTLTITSK